MEETGLKDGAASQKIWMDAERGNGRSRRKGRIVEVDEVDGEREDRTARCTFA